jgi:hypothetical protein
MDLHWGFNNLQIKEGDEPKVAFITHQGLFEPMVMQFGLCNTPSSFQAMMNEVLKEEVPTRRVVIYVDNVLVFTETVKEHQKLIVQVLEKLRRNWLFCRLEKCNFEKERIKFLGVEILKGTVHISLKKVKAIRE